MTEDEFLAHVRAYVAVHPSVAAHVANYAQAGLQEALSKAYERAADMEVALVCAIAPKMKTSSSVIADKLKKWEGQTSCLWDWYLRELAARELREKLEGK